MILQRSADEASEALETTAKCVLDAHPIIESHKDVWVLSPGSRKAVLSGVADIAGLKRRGVLWYVGPSADDARMIVQRWLEHHDRITSGDFAVLTGMTTQGARGALERLEGDLLIRGDATGRNAHFALRS